YLVVGGTSALRPLIDARHRISSASPWKLPVRLGFDAPGVGWISAAVVVVVTLCLMSSRLRSAAGAACGALGGYLLVAPYVLARWRGAVLPVAALERRRAAALILLLQGTLFVVWYQVLVHAPPSGEAVTTTRWLAPSASLVLLAAYLLGLRL